MSMLNTNKYVPEAVKISSVTREAFVHVINNVPEASAPEVPIRQVMLRCAGKGDNGMQKIVHQILGLNFTLVLFS